MLQQAMLLAQLSGGKKKKVAQIIKKKNYNYLNIVLFSEMCKKNWCTFTLLILLCQYVFYFCFNEISLLQFL